MRRSDGHTSHLSWWLIQMIYPNNKYRRLPACCAAGRKGEAWTNGERDVCGATTTEGPLFKLHWNKKAENISADNSMQSGLLTQHTLTWATYILKIYILKYIEVLKDSDIYIYLQLEIFISLPSLKYLNIFSISNINLKWNKLTNEEKKGMSSLSTHSENEVGGGGGGEKKVNTKEMICAAWSQFCPKVSTIRQPSSSESTVAASQSVKRYFLTHFSCYYTRAPGRRGEWRNYSWEST